jgi:hypothetical protein
LRVVAAIIAENLAVSMSFCWAMCRDDHMDVEWRSSSAIASFDAATALATASVSLWADALASEASSLVLVSKSC